jgi:hypothetical protein
MEQHKRRRVNFFQLAVMNLAFGRINITFVDD